MVAAEGDHTGMMLSICGQRNKRLAADGVITEGRGRGAMKELLVSLFDLSDGKLIVTVAQNK